MDLWTERDEEEQIYCWTVIIRQFGLEPDRIWKIDWTEGGLPRANLEDFPFILIWNGLLKAKAIWFNMKIATGSTQFCSGMVTI